MPGWKVIFYLMFIFVFAWGTEVFAKPEPPPPQNNLVAKKLQQTVEILSTPSYFLTFPNNPGEDGQVLSTDGNGNLDWKDAEAGPIGPAGQIGPQGPA